MTNPPARDCKHVSLRLEMLVTCCTCGKSQVMPLADRDKAQAVLTAVPADTPIHFMGGPS